MGSNRTVQDLLTMIKLRKLVCTSELRLLQLKLGLNWISKCSEKDSASFKNSGFVT
jgi:hypothetical protein